MSKKVLIAFGSRYGSTAEIAMKMKEWIQSSKKYQVDLVNLRKIKKSEFSPIEDYDGILVASGIKIGRWCKEVKEYLSSNVEILKNKKFGFFVSSGFAGDPNKYEQSKQDYVIEPLTVLGLEHAYAEAFGGVMDLTKDSNFGWFDIFMTKMISKDDVNIDPKGKNDFRDWEKIKQFTNEFLELV